ncbi:MAG TPA: 4-alpha-glucanotransferase, partial [Ilumatobacteraceae bacterium]|nr:4-alpha-glucanotransferase [Ilumatobacteraceae bacterium]
MDPSAGDPRVQTIYTDAAGQTIECVPEAVAAVLRALGDEPDDPLSVVVAWDGHLPQHATELTVVDDAGRTLDAPLPFGYHSLVRGEHVVGTVISTPRQAPAPTKGSWGVMLPLYSLRTEATQGVARYADLGRLFDWLHGHGGQVVLTLPLLPVFLDDPADWSPYSPVSRRLWSELYVDLDAAGAPPASDAPVPEGGLLDYPAIQRHRVARLDALAQTLADDPALHAWLRDNPVAERHARFRGAQARHGRNFRDWPVSREQALADADPVVVARHLVGQWLADTQLAAVSAHARAHGQLLALDVALGVHADGFDVFDEPDLFVEGVSVGAPPDPIFRGGQDWGFPPVHPVKSRRSGHRYIRETLRHHVRQAGLLRIDHVMGLARQW